MSIASDVDQVYNHLACTRSGNQDVAEAFDRVMQYIEHLEQVAHDSMEEAADGKTPPKD